MEIDLDLGRGTIIRITNVREMIECPDGSGSLPLDYHFLSRGRVSRYQIRKRLNRFVVGLLRQHLFQHDGPASRQASAASRDRSWIDAHIKVLLPST